MPSATPSFWDSMLEASASGLSPAFTEAFVVGDVPTIADVTLQNFAQSSSHQPAHAGHQFGLVDSTAGPDLDHLPPFDERLFDLVEIPELEDVKFPLDGCAVPILTSLSYDQLFDEVPVFDEAPALDEVPALEDIPTEELNWPSWVNEPPSGPATEPVFVHIQPPAPVSPMVTANRRSEDDLYVSHHGQVVTPQATTASFLIDDHCFIVSGYEEEVQASYAIDTADCLSPVSVCSQAGSTSSSGVERSSPLSGGFVSDDLAAMSPAERRRRISQVSMSSFCSSSGGPDSVGSPGSSTSGAASDSDQSSKPQCGGKVAAGGGRRSRFSAEDRKERKKAQNRTAAERYRQKRRQAEETVSEEEQQLMDANGRLRIEVTKLEAEVSCLKRLMREMLQAKGIEIPGLPQKKRSKTA
ncbi:hypothetical protein BIW11_10580 [Tropilaelaps mercedesae]|uniref:BZIP domain-containing protein n=1 Tax=Tropilaelaps mercedesae TaxID=418985 RepID=A0A1V9XFB3_9ACAR|nr:hypothetical protein BIW11_10580 [Tropilaelaps mercedesae]